MSTAMLPWQLFATSLSEGSGSLINNANLISKVYFPRLIVPASAVIVSFVDFAISMVLLGIIMAIYQVWPGWPLLMLPVFTLLTLLASAGAGIWLAALNEIPRLPLRRAVHRPVWALHFSGWLQQHDRAGPMASAL